MREQWQTDGKRNRHRPTLRFKSAENSFADAGAVVQLCDSSLLFPFFQSMLCGLLSNLLRQIRDFDLIRNTSEISHFQWFEWVWVMLHLGVICHHINSLVDVAWFTLEAAMQPIEIPPKSISKRWLDGNLKRASYVIIKSGQPTMHSTPHSIECQSSSIENAFLSSYFPWYLIWILFVVHSSGDSNHTIWCTQICRWR